MFCDLQTVVTASLPADAELCSQDHHYMQQDETCSDSRFAPGVHYQRLAVKFLICLQLKCSSMHPGLGWNIPPPSSGLLVLRISLRELNSTLIEAKVDDDDFQLHFYVLAYKLKRREEEGASSPLN